jgi:hypothetical protein
MRLPSGRDTLEDLLIDWQQQSKVLIHKEVATIGQEVERELSPKASRQPSSLSSLSIKMTQRLQAFAEHQLLPACLAYIRQQGGFRQGPGRAQTEVAYALQTFVPFPIVLPGMELEMRPRAWAVVAGVGALMGAIPLALITFLAAGQKDVGLFVGAPLGAAALVYLLTYLSSLPALRSLLLGTGDVTEESSLVTLRRLWDAGRGGLAELLRALGFRLALLLVRAIQPHIVVHARKDYAADVRRHVEGLLRHVADVVLALCWAHPDSHPTTEAGAESIPLAVHEALWILETRLREGLVEQEPLHKAIEYLLWQVREEGYTWEEIVEQTPYAAEMRQRFDNFGLIQPGQPVRTREPALLWKGEVRQRGRLERIRD